MASNLETGSSYPGPEGEGAQSEQEAAEIQEVADRIRTMENTEKIGDNVLVFEATEKPAAAATEKKAKQVAEKMGVNLAEPEDSIRIKKGVFRERFRTAHENIDLIRISVAKKVDGQTMQWVAQEYYLATPEQLAKEFAEKQQAYIKQQFDTGRVLEEVWRKKPGEGNVEHGVSFFPRLVVWPMLSLLHDPRVQKILNKKIF